MKYFRATAYMPFPVDNQVYSYNRMLSAYTVRWLPSGGGEQWGPSTEPWGTPGITDNVSPFTTTHCFLSLAKESQIHLRKWLLSCSFFIKLGGGQNQTYVARAFCQDRQPSYVMTDQHRG